VAAEIEVGSLVNDLTVTQSGDLYVATDLGLVALRLDTSALSGPGDTRVDLLTRRIGRPTTPTDPLTQPSHLPTAAPALLAGAVLCALGHIWLRCVR
jgi:hypothetical protein